MTRPRKTESLLLFATLTLPLRSPDIEILGFRLEQNVQNRKFLDVSSRSAEIFKQEQLAKINFPQSKFYQDSGGVIVLNASEALADLARYDMSFKGAAEVQSSDGFIVQGRDLDYSHVDEKIFTPESVHFESTPQLKSHFIQGWGRGFEANLSVKSFKFFNDFNLSMIPRESGASPSKVKGKSAEVFPQKGWAHVEGGIHFLRQNLKVQSDSLTLNFVLKEDRDSQEEALFQGKGADLVTALFDEYTLFSQELSLRVQRRREIDKISAVGEVSLKDNRGMEMSAEALEVQNPQSPKRKIRLSGRVKIKRGEDEATCNDASYDPESDLLVLRGGAAFHRGNDLMSGKEIRYSKKTGLLEVEGASGQFLKNQIIKNNRGQ